MREIWLEYSEVINTTEVLLVFATSYYGKQYANYLHLNIALPKVVQDDLIEQIIYSLENINGAKAREARNGTKNS